LKKSILTIAGVGVAGLILYTLTQAKQFVDSISFYISGVGIPEFEPNFVKIPVTVSFVNYSNFSIKLDQVMISIYRKVGSRWDRIGTSNPGNPVQIPSGATTDLQFTPRISLLQGLFPTINSFFKTGHQNLRIGVRAKVAGQFLPEQFEEFPIKISNGIIE
jgi:hypothetical protein